MAQGQPVDRLRRCGGRNRLVVPRVRLRSASEGRGRQGTDRALRARIRRRCRDGRLGDHRGPAGTDVQNEVQEPSVCWGSEHAVTHALCGRCGSPLRACQGRRSDDLHGARDTRLRGRPLGRPELRCARPRGTLLVVLGACAGSQKQGSKFKGSKVQRFHREWR